MNSLSYTGWKLVGVVPEGVQTASINKFRYYIIATAIILLMMLFVVNKIMAKKISKPILKLDESVKSYETGEKTEIYIGGASEIRHLAYSVQNSYKQIEQLMEEIIRQQNKRRKSEMDALQSQINPHFLYNTLESITWMVEANKNEEAVFMISELAKLLRISLSKGKTVIRISEELQHSKSYMNIQQIRYKDRFQVEFLIDKNVEECCTVKLVVQPLLENAIYYGVGNMDEDEDGKIIVRGEQKGNDIFLSVEDNGMGMSQEVVDNLLTNSEKVPKHGSGVGLINVHTRIQLMLIVLAAFFIIRIFSDNESMKRVAVIVEDSGDKRWDALLNGLKQSAENNNLHLIICNTDLIESMEDEEELINEQLQNNVDAFVICPAPGKETKTMLNRLQGERPFILINEDTYAEELSGYATVKPDNYKIGQMLAERLIQDDEEQLENKKIGVILGKAETEENVNRIAGLKDGLEGSGCEISWEYNYARGNQNTSEIIASKKQVDYLVILDNWALEEVGEAAEENKYHGAKIYGVGSSEKAIVLLDNQNIECLVVPDDYETGYKSMNEIAKKLRHSFYKMNSCKTEVRIINKEDLYSKDLERFLYSYE